MVMMLCKDGLEEKDGHDGCSARVQKTLSAHMA